MRFVQVRDFRAMFVRVRFDGRVGFFRVTFFCFVLIFKGDFSPDEVCPLPQIWNRSVNDGV